MNVKMYTIKIETIDTTEFNDRSDGSTPLYTAEPRHGLRGDKAPAVLDGSSRRQRSSIKRNTKSTAQGSSCAVRYV